MSSNKWIEMLELAGVEITDQLASGEITGVKVKTKEGVWRICVTLDKVLKVAYLNEVMEKIRNKFIEIYGLSKVLFTISYRNTEVEELTVAEYFKSAIEVCKSVKSTVSSLDAFTQVFSSTDFTFMISCEEDRVVIEEHLPLITAYFANYGLGHIKFNCEICEEEQSIKQIHHESRIRIESQNEAKAVEEYHYKKAIASSYEEQSTYQRNYANKPLAVLLNEIPMNSMEVEEFKQIRGTNKVELTGIIVKVENKDIKTRDGRELKLFQGCITDYNDTIIIKRFYREADAAIFEKEIKNYSN